jgi:hypothetical protein
METRKQDWAATALVELALLATGCGGGGDAIGPGGENVPDMPGYAVVSAAAAGTLVTVTPEADTYISSQSPSANFGVAPQFEVGGLPTERIAYLRFNVSGIPAGAQVTDARLTVVVSNPSSQSGGVIRQYAPASPTWAEAAPTWNDPLAGSDASGDLYAMGSVASGQTYTFTGLTSSIHGNGRVTFVIRSAGSDGAGYRSREYATSSQRPRLKVTFTPPSSPEATVGRWDAPLTTPVIAVDLNHLGNGKFLMWGKGGEPQTWSLTDGFQQVTFNSCTDNTTCILFCSGHTFLADGRLLVAGGHNDALGNKYGLKQASIFDGSSWSATGSMAYGRWYPTLVELADGNVVAISGSQTPSLNAAYPERYDGSSWTTLTGASLALPSYPRAFVEPKNGWIFYAGESSSRYLNPTGTGSWTTAGLGSGGVHARTDRSYGSAVMLDGKVFYIGGGGASTTCSSPPQNTAEVIDLKAATPTWRLISATMAFRRRQTNATILPDGTILVTGGTSSCGFSTETGAVFAAELYRPATGTWTTMANAGVVRVYHSTTALLPDGRVLSTGSGDGSGVAITQQYSYEIFSPPYLFWGARPTYSLPLTQMHYGQPFTVTTPDALSTTKVTIIRLASTTHAFDAGQRLNTLAFQASSDGQSLTVTPPAAGKTAPPGPYMLFILNGNGVPSVGQTVLLSP